MNEIEIEPGAVFNSSAAPREPRLRRPGELVRVTCTSSVGEQGRGSTLAQLSIEIIRNDFKTSGPALVLNPGTDTDHSRPKQAQTSLINSSRSEIHPEYTAENVGRCICNMGPRTRGAGCERSEGAEPVSAPLPCSLRAACCKCAPRAAHAGELACMHPSATQRWWAWCCRGVQRVQWC